MQQRFGVARHGLQRLVEPARLACRAPPGELADARGHDGSDQQVAGHRGRDEVGVSAAEHEQHRADDGDDRAVREARAFHVAEVFPSAAQPYDGLQRRNAVHFDMEEATLPEAQGRAHGDSRYPLPVGAYSCKLPPAVPP